MDDAGSENMAGDAGEPGIGNIDKWFMFVTKSGDGDICPDAWGLNCCSGDVKIEEGIGRLLTLVLLILLVAMAVVLVTAAAAAVVLALLLGKWMANGEVGAMAIDDDRARPELGFLSVPGESGWVTSGRNAGEAFVMVTRTGPPPPTATDDEAAVPDAGRGITGASTLVDRSAVVLRFMAGREAFRD